MMLDLLQWIPSTGELGIKSGTMLALIFFGASFVLIPRTFLCLGAGFGLAAIWIIMPSTLLGGILAFLLARCFVSGRVRALVDAHPRLRRVAEAVDEEGWRVVGLLRFASPLPQILLYVYIGSTGRQILDDETLSTLDRVMIGVGMTSLAVAAARIVRRVRQSLERSVPAGRKA